MTKEEILEKETGPLSVRMLEQHKDACYRAMDSYATAQTAELQKEIEKLKKEIDGWIRYKQNIDEALNSGDGSYRP